MGYQSALFFSSSTVHMCPLVGVESKSEAGGVTALKSLQGYGGYAADQCFI